VRLDPAPGRLPDRLHPHGARRHGAAPLPGRPRHPDRHVPGTGDRHRRRRARRPRLLRLECPPRPRPDGPTAGCCHRHRRDPTGCRLRHRATGDGAGHPHGTGPRGGVGVPGERHVGQPGRRLRPRRAARRRPL
ncbi:MAG: RsbS, negative regulator of sigma-B, partial [uncultured Nocardioidaceae bacterium]